MKNIQMIRKNAGITLVSLIVTIIILMILAGVVIATVTGNNGILSKSKLARDTYQNSANEENSQISSYENEIDKVSLDVASSREGTSSSIVSAIDKNDGIYNIIDSGYIFQVATSQITYTNNNIVKLKESIENYNYIEIEADEYYYNKYSYPFCQRFSVSQIKDHYNNTDVFNYKDMFLLINNAGDSYNRIWFWFKNNNTIEFQYGSTNFSDFTKIRITDIKLIK